MLFFPDRMKRLSMIGARERTCYGQSKSGEQSIFNMREIVPRSMGNLCGELNLKTDKHVFSVKTLLYL